MNFSKTREVITPGRANPHDAGIDFFIPWNTEEFIKDLENKNQNSGFFYDDKTITLSAHERILIPSGVYADVPKNHALIAFNKSGVSSKLGLDLLASVVDSGYQGEIHISVYNSSDYDIELSFGQKIIQFILIPINNESINEVDFEKLFTFSSSRGEGGFGSTGS